MLEDLLYQIGILDLHSMGDEIQGRCPEHERRTGQREQRPRHWSINRRTGQHHCFSCEYKGSLVRLIIEQTQLGVWEAHKLLRDHDVDLVSDSNWETWQPPESTDIEDQLRAFSEPPRRARDRRQLTLEACIHFGLLWNYELAEWVLPIFGPVGDLWGYQAKGENVRNHPPGIKKSRTLFGLHRLEQDETHQVLLVESPLDVVYLHGLGFPAVASFGASVSDRQMYLIVEHFHSVILALDNDTAGIKATRAILDERWHHRLPTTVFNYIHAPGKKDPGECDADQVAKAVDDAILAGFW
jgi:DNA primase